MDYNVNLARKCENNGMWKGDKVGYSALHRWVASRLGKPKICENCHYKTKKRYYWANKSGDYKRELNDWIRLCGSCHKIYDKERITKFKQIYKHRYLRLCTICKEKFTTISSTTKTCSPICQKIKVQKTWHKKKPRARRVCLRCKVVFFIPHAWLRKKGNPGIHCSRACRWNQN